MARGERCQIVSNSMGKHLGTGTSHSRSRIIRNGIDAVNGQGSVSTPSSLQALTVLRPTRGRRGAHVANPTAAELQGKEAIS